jgi:alkaline phosphatase D
MASGAWQEPRKKNILRIITGPPFDTAYGTWSTMKSKIMKMGKARTVRWLVIGLLAGISWPLTAQKKDKPLERIAFGSCDHQNNPVKLWDKVLAQDPDLWIWGGDNVYGDTDNMDTLRNKYARQKSNPGYSRLRESVKITGTYDDHDYGVNDGGREYRFRDQSRDILFDFLDIPADDPARKRRGAYHSRTYGPKGRQVKVINLDTRFFRDPLKKVSYTDPQSGKQEQRYEPTEGLDILGEEQWAWLERELKGSKASIHIINSSIQVVSEQHRFEKWANFPTARKRLFDLIARSGAKGVVILSGDRHIAEVSRIDLKGLPYPLYDLTSSGLTHTWGTARPEENSHRVGDLIVKRNFGLIRIDWRKGKPEVTYEILGHDEKAYARYALKL